MIPILAAYIASSIADRPGLAVGFVGGFMQNVLTGKARVKLQASDLSLISDVVYEGESYGKAFASAYHTGRRTGRCWADPVQSP